MEIASASVMPAEYSTNDLAVGNSDEVHLIIVCEVAGQIGRVVRVCENQPLRDFPKIKNFGHVLDSHWNDFTDARCSDTGRSIRLL